MHQGIAGIVYLVHTLTDNLSIQFNYIITIHLHKLNKCVAKNQGTCVRCSSEGDITGNRNMMLTRLQY